jgi:hypothetical protein
MARCEDIRPLLCRSVDHEVEPTEAFVLAAHLADCTACKIVLARRRRLAEMLERDLPDIPVGEDFVRAVMDTLPDGPPPRRARRGIKLAVLLCGIAGASGIAARPWLEGNGVSARMMLPGLESSPPDSLPRSLDVLGWAVAAVDAAVGKLALAASVPAGVADAASLLAVSAGSAAVVACGLALAAGWLLHGAWRRPGSVSTTR